MVVAPLLFQVAFNFAFYPRVPGRSPPLYELAPMGGRRFTKSPGTSPSDGSSLLPGLCRFWALATALAVQACACPSCPWRRELPQPSLRITVGHPPSPNALSLWSRCKKGCCGDEDSAPWIEYSNHIRTFEGNIVNIITFD